MPWGRGGIVEIFMIANVLASKAEANRGAGAEHPLREHKLPFRRKIVLI